MEISTHRRPSDRMRVAGAAAAVLVVTLGVMAPPTFGRTRSLHAKDRATLRYVSSTVSVFYETGRATGTLPGRMRVHMRLGSRFTGVYVIETHGGSIRGRGSAVPHGRGVYESFAGTITVTGGSGRYRHAHGHARVYGTFDRINNELKVQTTGTLRY